MDQDIQVYFIINPDLVHNGHGLHYGKRNTFYFFIIIFDSFRVVFIKGIESLSFIFIFQFFSILSNRKAPLKFYVFLIILLSFYFFF